MTNQQWTVRHTAMVLAGVVVVLAIVAAVFGLHWLLRASPDAWASAIVAIATVVLVAVTAWYSYLTFKLLQAQRASARTSAQEEAMRDLNRFMAPKFVALLKVKKKYFPVDATTAPADPWDAYDNAMTITNKLLEVSQPLVEFQALLPARFPVKVWQLTQSLVDALEESLGLARAVTGEIGLSEYEKRGWTWAGAQTFYADTDYADTEAWSDVVDGKKFQDAVNACDELLRDVEAYLAH